MTQAQLQERFYQLLLILMERQHGEFDYSDTVPHSTWLVMANKHLEPLLRSLPKHDSVYKLRNMRISLMDIHGILL